MGMQARFATRCLILVALASSIGSCAGQPPAPPQAAATPPVPAVARFEVSNGPPAETFIIELTDPARIAEARAQLAGTAPPRHVLGLIVKSAAAYNPRWRFHLDPASISFFEMSTEVCDARTSYVQSHLSQVGGAFLPGNRWCPWNSRLAREVTAAAPQRQ